MVRFRLRWYAVVCLAVGLAGVGGCPPQVTPPSNGGDGGGGGGGGGGATDGGVVTVSMRNIAFSPSSITIQAGQTVRWVNRDIVPHTVTSGDPGTPDAGALFDSGLLGLGGTFERTFNETGTFEYFCETHPGIMRDARVIVQ